MLFGSCKYHSIEFAEEFEDYEERNQTPDLACQYTKQALLKYTDMLFTLYYFQNYLNSLDDKDIVGQYVYLGNNIKMEPLSEGDSNENCYRMMRFSNNGRLEYIIKVYDADKPVWTVKARSEEDDTLFYQMKVAIDGESWTISNASSKVLGMSDYDNASIDELESDRYVTFSGSDIRMNILWERAEDGSLYAIINSSGTLESLITPKLVLHFNTIRPLIVMENNDYKGVNYSDSYLKTVYNKYFTQWISGKLALNVDNKDGSQDEIIAEMLTPTKVKAYFKGQESEWEW